MLLTADEIRAAGKIDAPYVALWEDVQRVADRVHATSGNQRAWAWHHLLLAVANFKTQATLFPPGLLPAPETISLQREDVLVVPMATGTLELRAEDAATWTQLLQLKGLREPRATTVLSALWPGRHIIMDWRALSAALALAGARLGWSSSAVDPSSTRRAKDSWESYAWYRDTVLRAASQAEERPLIVERALWRVGRKAPGMTWAKYASQVEERLQQLAQDQGE
jgi:hypothetical protein